MQHFLPEECLALVFLYLAQERSALHALILVNHQFFRLVTPILYRSPFRLLESKTEHWSWSERTQRQVFLLQLFLHSAQIRQSDREARQQRHKNKSQLSYRKEQKSKDKNIMGSVIDTALTTIDISEWYLKFSGRTINSTKQKKKQRWFTKKQLSTKEPNSSTPPRSLRFLPTPTISKKEINVAAVVPDNKNIQGKHIPLIQQPMLWSQNYQLETPSNSLTHSSSDSLCQCLSLMDNNNYREIEHISNSHFSSCTRSCYHCQENSQSQNCSKKTHGKMDDKCSCNDDVSRLSRLSDSDIEDDDCGDSEDELPMANSLFSKNQPTFEPNLGPFSRIIDDTPTKTWSQTLQHQLKSFRISGTGKIKKNHEVPTCTVTRPMADYLSYYTDQDHPRLARVLSSIFPNHSVENFDHLLTTRDSMPNGSPSFRPSILDIFNSLRQPSMNSQGYKKAISVLTMVERELLHHSPRKIRSISLSASRFHPVIRPPNRQQHLPEPGLQLSLFDKPLTSLISLFSISPFTKSIAAPTHTLPFWHSSASSFSVFSSLSTHSTFSSLLLTDGRSWSNVPNLSHLSHLYRLELYDIHPEIDVEAVVDFLKLHDQTYDTIREIKLGGPGDLGRPSHPDVVQILQCLKKIKVLDMIEWKEAINFLPHIPTKHLETLLLGNVRTTAVPNTDPIVPLPQAPEVVVVVGGGSLEDDQEDTPHPQIQALQKCRLLRELRMPVLVEGLFAWAANERQQRQSAPLAKSTIKTPSMKTPPYWYHDQDPLVQLEDVHLNGSGSGHLISTLIHVVDASRESIRTLQSSSWMASMETPTCYLSLSWDWYLPRLQVLDLQGEVAQRFLVQSLQYCPLLKVLRLSLPHYPITVPLWAIPDSLDCPNSPDVRCTHCKCQGCGNGNIGCSYCGLKPQPLSFADYLCPLYNIYHNAIHFIPPTYVPKMKQQQQQQQQQQQRHILFPELEELRLVGDWSLHDRSLLEMAQIMPRLKRLSLLQCESEQLTAQGLIKALPRLREKHQDGLKFLEVSKSWQNELETALETEKTLAVSPPATTGCSSCALVIHYH